MRVQIKNAATPRPIGRTRALWNAVKRHSPPRLMASNVWMDSRSGEGLLLPRMIVPPLACTSATSGVTNRMLVIFPKRRVPFSHLSKSSW